MRIFVFLSLFLVAACERGTNATVAAPAATVDPHAGHEHHDHDHAHDHAAASAAIPPPSGEPGVVDVYMSPTCGCCGKWVSHLEANGFKVNAHKVESPIPVKIEYGLPRELASCHTGIVDGYLVEGHVPASVIKRLITERPKIKGISVPRMPEGSPGMEGPNPEAYDVIAYTESGSASVYQHIPVQ